MPEVADLAEVRVLAARGELGDARTAVERILEDRPEDHAALLLLASLLLESREEERALAVYQRAVERHPESAEALVGAARCLHLAGRNAEALELAERARSALDLGENFVQAGPVYVTLVWCLREQRRYREALALAEEGLRRCDDAILAHWAATVEQELAEAERERC